MQSNIGQPIITVTTADIRMGSGKPYFRYALIIGHQCRHEGGSLFVKGDHMQCLFNIVCQCAVLKSHIRDRLGIIIKIGQPMDATVSKTPRKRMVIE